MTTEVAAAQGRAANSPQPSPCWRFAFGEWKPALDWAKAGHWGSDSGMAKRVDRARDSIHLGNPAARAPEMTIEYVDGGMRVMLYPPWWPIGVLIVFPGVTPATREVSGTAKALVADAAMTPPAATARAQQIACPKH